MLSRTRVAAFLSLLGGALGMSSCMVPGTLAPETTFFELATADPGGIYVPLGRSLCILYNLERPEHLPTCRAPLTHGSVDNIERLRRGEAQVAVVQADVLHWAWIGGGPFAGAAPFRDIAVLFTAHDEVVTVLAAKDLDIAEAADARGKRVAIGVRESGSRATLDALMEAMDWSPADFASFEVMPVGAQIDALCAGQVDVAAFVVGHPSGYVQRALYDCGARLLPGDDPAARKAIEALPFLRMGSIPAGTYRDQEADLPAPALTALVVARRDWPAETARAFMASIREQVDILRRMHPALAQIDLDRPDRAAEEVGMYLAEKP